VRGEQDAQVSMLAFIDVETRIPQDHPLRAMRRMADDALVALSPTFDAMYSELGRPSIPPERLLKASLLISLYSIRSERAFCEQLAYNELFRWFLGMSLIEPTFDASTFSKNRQRASKKGLGSTRKQERTCLRRSVRRSKCCAWPSPSRPAPGS
jgi:transposase